MLETFKLHMSIYCLLSLVAKLFKEFFLLQFISNLQCMSLHDVKRQTMVINVMYSIK